MSLLRRVVGAPEARDVSLSEALAKLRGVGVSAGVSVSEESAMRHAAVWACMRLISEAIGQLPVGAHRKIGDIRQPVDPQPQLLVDPSARVSLPEWIGQGVVSVLQSGNTYGVVAARDRLMHPTQIELVAPRTVTVRQTGSGSPDYRVSGTPIAAEDMFHVRGFSLPGEVVGLSPIAHARETIGLGLAAEKFGAGVFGKGGHPTGILKSDQVLDPAKAEEAKLRFKRAVDGGDIAALGAGLSYESIQMTLEDAQFLETQRWSVLQIAKFFGVPPEMIGAAPEGSSVTYANREQRALDFVTFALMPWIVRFEAALTRMLPRGQFVKFNTSALLRADTLTRYQAHAIGIKNRFLLPDEAREKEDRPPLPDGAGKTFPTVDTSPELTDGPSQEGSP